MIIQALQDHWRNTSPEGYAVTMASGLLGMVAHVDWAAMLSFTCLAASMLGGTGISLYKSWRLAQLEIAERERKAKACVGRPEAQ
jgi:hypothetical protein